MLVAISQKNVKDKHGNDIDTLRNDYQSYFEKLGIKLVLIPNSTEHIAKYFELPIQGIILSGSNNINPKLYGEDYPIDDVSDKRDQVETKLLEIAIEKNLPVLGICRGMHFINVFFKGKLVNITNHVNQTHEIKLSNGLNGETSVNSYHNQGIDEKSLSSELNSFAITNDNLIEGIFHPNKPIAGIEWHPERQSPDQDINKTIIEAFMNRTLFWRRKE